MPHVNHYYNGKRLVSVTELLTVINKPFLKKWTESLCDYQNGKCGFKEAQKVAEEAGNLGNAVHEQIEGWFKKGPMVEGAYEVNMWSDKIIAHYQSKNVKPYLIEAEENLLDTESNLAGSPDHIIEYDGMNVIADLKIKNSLDPLTALQGCGYRYLLKRKKNVDINKMLVIWCKKKTVGKLIEPIMFNLDEFTHYWKSLVDMWNMVNPSRKVVIHE